MVLQESSGAIEQIKGTGRGVVLGVGHGHPGSGPDVVNKDPGQANGTTRLARFREDGDARGQLKDGRAGRRLASLIERDHGVTHVGSRAAGEFSLKGPVGIDLVGKRGAGHPFQVHSKGQAVIIEQLDLSGNLTCTRIHQEQLGQEPRSGAHLREEDGLRQWQPR